MPSTSKFPTGNFKVAVDAVPFVRMAIVCLIVSMNACDVRKKGESPFMSKNKNLEEAALFKHSAEQYCKIYLNYLQDQKYKIVSSTKENLFQFTPGLSEKKIFEMSIQQNNPNIKNKK